MSLPRIALVLSLCCAGLASGQTPQQPNAGVSLKVTGDIAAPLVLTADDLANMPRETASFPDHDGTKASYGGVSLKAILTRAGALGKDLHGKALATYILATAHDGYQVLFSIGEIDSKLGNEAILVVDKRDGKALTGNQGPLRIVCPNDKAGARSLRMLETLEVVSLAK